MFFQAGADSFQRRFGIDALRIIAVERRNAAVNLGTPFCRKFWRRKCAFGQALLQDISQIRPVFGEQCQSLLGNLFANRHGARLIFSTIHIFA